MPKRSPQEQALHQAQQPTYEALVLRKEIADLKRQLSDSSEREQEIERELAECREAKAETQRLYRKVANALNEYRRSREES